MSWQQFVHDHARPCVSRHNVYMDMRSCMDIWMACCSHFSVCVCVCLNVYFGSKHRNGVNIIMTVMCGYCFESSGWAWTFSSSFFLSFFSLHFCSWLQLIIIPSLFILSRVLLIYWYSLTGLIFEWVSDRDISVSVEGKMHTLGSWVFWWFQLLPLSVSLSASLPPPLSISPHPSLCLSLLPPSLSPC